MHRLKTLNLRAERSAKIILFFFLLTQIKNTANLKIDKKLTQVQNTAKVRVLNVRPYSNVVARECSAGRFTQGARLRPSSRRYFYRNRVHFYLLANVE